MNFYHAPYEADITPPEDGPSRDATGLTVAFGRWLLGARGSEPGAGLFRGDTQQSGHPAPQPVPYPQEVKFEGHIGPLVEPRAVERPSMREIWERVLARSKPQYSLMTQEVFDEQMAAVLAAERNTQPQPGPVPDETPEPMGMFKGPIQPALAAGQCDADPDLGNGARGYAFASDDDDPYGRSVYAAAVPWDESRHPPESMSLEGIVEREVQHLDPYGPAGFPAASGPWGPLP